jgi:hypothetical protein
LLFLEFALLLLVAVGGGVATLVEHCTLLLLANESFVSCLLQLLLLILLTVLPLLLQLVLDVAFDVPLLLIAFVLLVLLVLIELLLLLQTSSSMSEMRSFSNWFMYRRLPFRKVRTVGSAHN